MSLLFNIFCIFTDSKMESIILHWSIAGIAHLFDFQAAMFAAENTENTENTEIQMLPACPAHGWSASASGHSLHYGLCLMVTGQSPPWPGLPASCLNFYRLCLQRRLACLGQLGRRLPRCRA
ncbi:MAG: hypothetical protein V4488_17870 [Pseudomonadota bacterium]